MFKKIALVAALAFSTVTSGCIITSDPNQDLRSGGGLAYRFTGSTSSGSDCRLDGSRTERVNRISGGAFASSEALFVSTTQLGTDRYRVQVFVARDVPSPAVGTVLEERIYDFPFSADGRVDSFNVDFNGDRLFIEIAGIPAGAGCSYAF